MGIVCPRCHGTKSVAAPTGFQKLKCTECRTVFSAPSRKRVGPKRRTTRGRSDVQEGHNKRGTRGARSTPNSGAMDDKGDVKVPGLLREEDKTTYARSFSLRLADLQKVAAAARGDEMPIMRISFEDDLNQQYVVMDSHWFNQLFELWRSTKEAV